MTDVFVFVAEREKRETLWSQGPGEDDIARHSPHHECVDEFFPPTPNSVSSGGSSVGAAAMGLEEARNLEWHRPRGALYVHSERCGDVVVREGGGRGGLIPHGGRRQILGAPLTFFFFFINTNYY